MKRIPIHILATSAVLLVLAALISWFACIAAPITAAALSLLLSPVIGRWAGPAAASAASLAVFWNRIPHVYLLNTPGGAAMTGMIVATTVASAYLATLVATSFTD